MRPRERESLSEYSDDAHSLLFGLDDADAADAPAPRLTRADRRRMEHAHRKRHLRRGQVAVLIVAAIVVIVAVVAIPRILDFGGTADYSGSGFGSVQVRIPAGSTASDIGDILHGAGVVDSTAAFTDAAAANSASQNIQPGSYRLHKHMSGKSALALLLDPSSRNTSADVAVPEGATSLSVRARLVQIFGQSKAGEIDAALRDPKNLSLPSNYGVNGHPPRSVEGFLYPATYPPNATATETLQSMVLRFIRQDRTTNFAASAKRLNVTPYQALTIASIAQSEAKFPKDMPKVVRTIRNRLHAGMPLQSDATSAYACKLQGTKNCIYNQVDSPYNSYRHKGLPPTPIDNPGADAMHAAVHPAPGGWLYFVNVDKAGHLGFFRSASAFNQAVHTCAVHHWGCAG